MTAHVFVIGPHETHAPTFERLEGELDVRFHELLAFHLVRKASRYDIDDLLARAEGRIERSEIEPDAIATYWDFPSSSLACILCDRYELPTTPLGSALACEHKHWARTVQRRVAPEVAPPFQAVDPTRDLKLGDLKVEPPLWLKPVKSYSGHLGFLVECEADLQRAVRILRLRIRRLGDPFNQVLERVEVPVDVGEVDGNWAIAEGLLEGRQCTIEGHVQAGETHVHGVFDIHRVEGGSSFSHYGYPTTLPRHTVEEMHEAAATILTEIGYGDASFNVEFFWEPDTDTIRLLEINPRISQEHSEVMWYADGATNLRIMTELALGRAPTYERGEGIAEVAGKFFVRTTEDAVVTSVPPPGRVAELEERFAPCRIELGIEPGDRLSELEDQESYSYELASVYLGGPDRDALGDRFDRLGDELGIGLSSPAETSTA